MSPTQTTSTGSVPVTSAVKSPTSKLAPVSIAQSTPNPVKQLSKEINEKMHIEGDELTKEDFDVKTLTSAIIKTNMLSEHLANLSQSIHRLDKEIREEVSKSHEDLLHQAINIETLEEMLEMIQTRIHSLKSTSERLRLKISLPFDELSLRIRQLSRLQAACDTLRRVKGILAQSGKLRVHMQTGGGNVRDLVKSAQCLNELDFLLRNFDHAGIDIIESDVHFAVKSRREVEEQAQLMLDRSLAHMDQGQIGTSLQVFYSLGILNQKLVDTLKTNEKSFQKLSADLLNTTNLTLQSTNNNNSSSHLLHTSASMSVLTSGGAQFPGRSNMPNVGSMGQFRAQLWINFEKLMDNLYDSCSQVAQLQLILEKKKDLITNVFYIDEIDFGKIYAGKMYLINNNIGGGGGIESDVSQSVNSYDSICTVIDEINEINSKKSIEFLYDMWRRLTQVLSTQLQTASQQSNYIKQTFQNEYPRLLKLQNDLWLRLMQLNGLVDRYRYPSQQQQQQSSLQSSSGDKMSSSRAAASLPSSATNFQSAYELLRKCFTEFENSYLNRSLSHLFDPINLIYSSSQSLDKQINRSDMDSYLRGVQSQLQTLQYDSMFNSSSNINNKSTAAVPLITNSQTQSGGGYVSVFSDKVVGNICKSIQMFANKGEQYLNSLNAELQSSITQTTSNNSSSGMNSGHNQSSTGGKSNIFFQSGTGLAYQIQMKNLDYLNATHDLHEQLVKLFDAETNLNTRLSEKLRQSLKSLTSFEENALKPFVQAASECILAIILTMHQEDFNNVGFSSSLYIKELQQVLQRICRDYLQQYACKMIIQSCMNQLAARSIELFIRHAAILRPMSDVSRKRLINDSNQLEAIIQSQLSVKLTDLGVMYKQLKAFRHLLETKSPYDIQGGSSVGDGVVDETHYETVLGEQLPHSLLLSYLFSYAPNEMKSPHQNLDWPPSRYSDWLDKHTGEKERLLVIKACLESYVNVVKQRRETKFANLYPLLIRLLEKGIQINSSN